MTKAICSLLNHPEKRQHMIEQGLKYVTRFSEQRQAEELMNLYRSLTEEKQYENRNFSRLSIYGKRTL